MAEVRLLGERVEEGERKRGWRKRKEENGVQAPNRAEIILDHKGWNSIENLGYSKNCQSIVEKGKRPDEQDVGVEGQVQVLTAWPEKKRRVNDTLSLIFFLKNTSSPVNVMEKWRTAWRCWKENSYAKMRSWRELKKNWYVLRMTLFIYPLKRKSEHLWTLRVRMIKEFNPRGICGGHLWTLRMRMRKILNPIFKYLNSFFGLNWLNEYEKDFEPNILIPLKEGIGIDLWFWPCSFCGRHLVDL